MPDSVRLPALHAERAVSSTGPNVPMAQTPKLAALTSKVDQLQTCHQQQQPFSHQHQQQPVNNAHQQYRRDGFTMSTLLIFVLVGLVQINVAHGSNLLQRLNYGVLFERHSEIVFSREYWLHTYEINLPTQLTLPSKQTCYKDNVTCLIISHIQTQINSLHIETAARLNNTLTIVKQLVPNASVMKRPKSKRSLLSFIDQFSETLHGRATVNDVNVLANHMNALNKHSRSIETTLAHHAKHLSSFESKVNGRMDNLVKGIKENNIAIHYIQRQLQTTADSLQETFEMTSLLMKHIKASNDLNHELDQIKQGVIHLANGHLSPFLIPIDILKSSLNNVQDTRTTKHPGFYITLNEPSDMYSHAHFLYTRNNSVLYLTIKIPISSEPKPLQVYKVISLPVPINQTSKHATSLLDLPKFFAITTNQQFYLSLSNEDLDKCKGSSTFMQCQHFPLTPITKQSCILALFSNNKETIHKLCNFRFVPDVISPRLMLLHSNKVLLYQTPTLAMQCGMQHHMIQGCNFCMFEVPCQCSLSAREFYLPAQLTSCHNTSKHITKLHPVNLVLLQEFFDSSQYQNILADTLFHSPLNVSLPQFKLYNHEMAHVLAMDQHIHLNLSRMVNKAKKDEVIFQTLAEQILDGEIPIKQKWPDLNGILTIVAMAISIFSTIASFCLFRKMKYMATILLLMQEHDKGIPN